MTRTSDYRLLMSLLAGWCALGLAGSLWPAADRVVSIIVFAALGAAGAAVATLIARTVWAEIQLHRECTRVLRAEHVEVHR